MVNRWSSPPLRAAMSRSSSASNAAAEGDGDRSVGGGAGGWSANGRTEGLPSELQISAHGGEVYCERLCTQKREDRAGMVLNGRAFGFAAESRVLRPPYYNAEPLGGGGCHGTPKPETIFVSYAKIRTVLKPSECSASG